MAIGSGFFARGREDLGLLNSPISPFNLFFQKRSGVFTPTDIYTGHLCRFFHISINAFVLGDIPVCAVCLQHNASVGRVLELYISLPQLQINGRRC